MEFYLERLDKEGEPPVRLPAGPTSIGRHPSNNIVLPAADRCVSGYHALIYVDNERLLLQDLQSSNGTSVNGRDIHERVVKAGDEIGFGRSGPRFMVVAGTGVDGGSGFRGGVGFGIDGPAAAAAPARPLFDGSGPAKPSPFAVAPTLGESAAAKRSGNIFDNNDFHNGDNHDGVNKPPPAKIPASIIITAIVTVVLLIAMITLMSFMFRDNSQEPTRAAKDFFSAPAETLPDTIPNEYDISSNAVLNRHGAPPSKRLKTAKAARAVNHPHPHPPPSVEAKIDAILRRFGETDYRTPAEMVERVDFYLRRFSGPMKRTVSSYMDRRKRYFPMIRRVFTEKNIPLDLAYVSILESGLDPYAESHAGAKGLWQFMPKTARAYGLEVSAKRDDRTDPEKATYAAAAYFKDLIAVFGSKSSVMLCMAAYNAGEHRVMNALRRIEDPVNNRDFWYLYKMGWLAEETNEYIPQVLALIIISEDPEEYGFDR